MIMMIFISLFTTQKHEMLAECFEKKTLIRPLTPLCTQNFNKIRGYKKILPPYLQSLSNDKNNHE